jgi:hypothetical protein
MPTIQEQYTEVARQGQDAVLTAVDAWTRAVEDMAGKMPAFSPHPDYSQVIDQFYDFASNVIDAQRTVAKTVLNSSVSFTESITEHATSTAHEAAETVTAAAKKATAK